MPVRNAAADSRGIARESHRARAGLVLSKMVRGALFATRLLAYLDAMSCATGTGRFAPPG
jgi:hypothetical protein